MLVSVIWLTSGGAAALEFSGPLQHELEQAQGDATTPAGEHGKACEHGCLGHLAFHFFGVAGPVASIAERDSRVLGHSRAPVLVLRSLPDFLFRPPRFSLA